MRGPSDAFFKDIVNAVGGDLLQRLPDVVRRQNAARALGQNLSLAELAAKMGLIDDAKLVELERLEKGDADPEAAPLAPKTPSASKTAAAKTPTAKVPGAGAKLPSGSAAKRAEAPEAEAEEEGASGRDAKRRPRPAKGGSRPLARGGAPPSGGGTGILLVLIAVVIAILLIVGAVVFQQQPPPPVASPSLSPARRSPAPPRVEASPVAAPSPSTEPGQETDGQRQSRLTKIAMDAINAASAGDFTGAKKKLAKLRLEATPADMLIVKEAEKDVDQIKAAAERKDEGPSNLDAEGHRKPPVVDTPDDPTMDPNPSPPPGANPAEAKARAAYRELRARLDPLLAKLDLDGARALLAQAPALEGSAAQDLEDDKLVPGALDKFLAVAARGVKKLVGTDQELHLAAGAKIRGKISDVDSGNVTVAVAAGEQLVKVSELDRDDLLAFSSQGTTKDTLEDYALGRGLVAYYGGDVDGASPSLAATKLPLGKRLLGRIAREGGAPFVPRAKGPPPKQPDPRRTPDPSAPPANPDDAAGADIAALQAKVHAYVADEGEGRIGLRYTMSNDNDASDWDGKGCDRWEVTSTEKPGTTKEAFRDLECGISSYDDIAILHKIPLKGDIDYTVEFWVNYLNPETSNLLFVIGVDKKRWLGASFGQQLWKSDGKARKAVSSVPPDFARFANTRDCVVRLVRKGDKTTLFWNGAETATASGTAGFDGKWGLLAHNLRIGIRRVEIHGVAVADAPKK